MKLRTAVFLIVGLVLACPSYAQTTGRILGVVRDRGARGAAAAFGPVPAETLLLPFLCEGLIRSRDLSGRRRSAVVACLRPPVRGGGWAAVLRCVDLVVTDEGG